ncbi:MAG: hypothetical protein IJM20_07960 [Clostridia bacterium]|nr:hypothetical protein [Clostridia bacterium]
MFPARRKAQEYSERLPSIFNAAGREKIPFEAVYPYADTPKRRFIFQKPLQFEKRYAKIVFVLVSGPV